MVKIEYKPTKCSGTFLNTRNPSLLSFTKKMVFKECKNYFSFLTLAPVCLSLHSGNAGLLYLPVSPRWVSAKWFAKYGGQPVTLAGLKHYSHS